MIRSLALLFVGYLAGVAAAIAITLHLLRQASHRR